MAKKGNGTRKIAYVTGKLIQLSMYTLITIGVLIFFVHWYTGIPTIDEKTGDVSSWVALVVGIGIGIFIAISVVVYSNYSQKEMKKLITQVNKTSEKIDKMVQPISKTFEDRKRSIQYQLLNSLRDILSHAEQVIFYREKWELESNIDVKQKVQKEIEEKCKNIRQVAEKVLENPDVISRDILTLENINTYKIIASQCKIESVFNYEKNECQVSNCFVLRNMIPDHLKYYEEELGLSTSN